MRIRSILHCSGYVPVSVNYLLSLPHRHSLAAIEQEHLLTSRLLSTHARYYVREMRILGYSQILESYRSLTLASLATSFGVSIDFVDRYVEFAVIVQNLCVND